ncbi:MAG: Ribonuclease HI [Candidatus Diapherotrites archaeon ADurb.Bin253]|jgi:ribonuclease HI|nr:ribonuclease HI family protein [Candidatus Pacearchaeota archaeon]OQA68899.1 MAG: Ribonuclease HI [Candidatus Diapherotrites archaeon ADurb.Bin253]HNZ51780.1 ribonuclease HI family protein [Candidatus Pacearchaeota archaeon]HOF43782.1 ribonuclease HI family protein [Candidatus Pacearchaeota archaeon]HOH03900.1 ribonuclease HI family protein [Candidatus Pacearchaeota archaeon]
MIYTNSDGGARGNPGPGAVAALVRKEGEIITKYSKFIGENTTNNVAEYEGLILALELASNITKDEITCFLDSELVVKQLLGEYKVRNKNILPLFLKVQKLQERFKKIKYAHVPRTDNFQIIVDEMLNEELDNKGYRKNRFRRRK